MSDDAQYALPLRERRDRLAAGLIHLVKKQGFEWLVQAPLLHANERCFPDEFALTQRGVARLIRRLLAYAGLGHLSVALEVDSAVYVDETGAKLTAEEYVPPAWFAGIEGSVCRFGIDVRITRDPDSLVGILCHEVAHAFREFHGLRTAIQDIEEALTDLTTVYLGFGLLTTNATYRYTTSGETRGYVSFTYRSSSRTGYLDPGEMSLLLAMYAVARQMRPSQLRSIRSELGVTQAELFDEALEWFDKEGKDYIEQLGLPPRSEWSPERTIAQACVELPALDEVPDTPLFAETPPSKEENKGRRVYRIEHRYPGIGMCIGAAFALVAWNALPFGAAPNAVLCLLIIIMGRVAGRSYRSIECAGAGCDATLKPYDVQCPQCGGVIVGTVRNRMERMAREEEDEQRGFDS